MIYDFLNRMTSEDNGPDPARTWVYDAAGNVTQYTGRLGRITEYTPDELNRIVEERWKSGGATIRTISSVFDNTGLLTSISDTDATYGYGYDPAGRNTSVSNAGTAGAPTVVLTNVFDNMDRRTERKASVNGGLDFKNVYTFDAASRATRIDQIGQGGAVVAEKRVDLGWSATSQIDTITRYKDTDGGTANEVAKSTYTRDKLDRVTDLVHKKGTNPAIATYHWNFDTVSRVTSMSGPDGSSTYGYDFTSQVTTADHSFQTDESYGYDDAGNRNMTGYSTAANNRLTCDGVYSYENDAEGNRTKRTKIVGGEYETYDYDHRNRLTKVTFYTSGGTAFKALVYKYDPYDRRIARWEDPTAPRDLNDAVIEHFAWDGPDVVLDFVDSDGPSGSTPTLSKRYLHGPLDDQIFGQEDVLKTLGHAERVLWPLADNLGTTRDLANQTGTVITGGHYKFDTFGKLTAGDATKTRYLYAGRELDTDSGLYYNRARWYDPGTGRFTTEDPIGFAAGDFNLSRYVGNGPTNATDPTGLDRLDIGNIEYVDGTEQKALGYYDPEWAPKFRVPLYYVNEPWHGVGEESDPEFVGHYYPELGFVEHLPGGELDNTLGHGHRVAPSKLSGEVSGSGTTDDWETWFRDEHNPNADRQRGTQARIGLGNLDPDHYDKIERFENTAEILANVNLAFYGIASGLAQPSQVGMAARTAITGRRILSNNSIWRKVDRGIEVEKALGGNLPTGFPTFDRFKNGTATSIKSMNLLDKSYRDTRNVTRTVRGYVDEVAQYTVAKRKGVLISSSQISRRVLELAIPSRSMNGKQAAAMKAAMDYARSKDVHLIIIEMR